MLTLRVGCQTTINIISKMGNMIATKNTLIAMAAYTIVFSIIVPVVFYFLINFSSGEDEAGLVIDL